MNQLTKEPRLWANGETIPWNDPEFSRRMLAEHLSQLHDAASRRFEIVDQHVDFINSLLSVNPPAKILDLGCGPGLYANRLAGMGHRVTGIDFSPASIAYAKQQAVEFGGSVNYRREDIRLAEYGSEYDLSMLIFGELNVFEPSAARQILQKMYAALKVGGRLVIEPHPFAAIRNIGESSSRWEALESGLFSERPHLYLTKGFWAEAQTTATMRHVVVDIETGDIDVHDACMQAYSDDEYRDLLSACGFRDIEIRPSLTGSAEGAHSSLFVILAKK
jgi:SAM-dependent methyltransferase